MNISAHTISNKPGTQRKAKRVGRGNASGKGTTAARGMNGQKSRSGGRGGRKAFGFRQSLLKIPKLRGFTSHAPQVQTVTLATLERIAAEGITVTPVELKNRSAIKSAVRPIKIVATGELTKKVRIEGCHATKKAVEAIEKAGGNIVF